MKGLIILALCALASAAVPVEYNAPLGYSAQQQLSNSKYWFTYTDPRSYPLSGENVAALASSKINQDRSLLEGQIINALEGFRDVIIHGTDAIPVLDPFVLNQIGPYIFMATGVRAEGTIRNLNVEGLRWFIIDRVTLNPIRLTLGFQVTLPWIITTGSYDARATVAVLNHQAGGNFRVFVNRLVLSADLRLGTNILGGGHLFLRELDIKIDIHDTHIQIDGMFGSSLINNFINAFVQNLTQEVVQAQMENVSAMLSEQLFDVVNDFLRDFTLDDLLS